MIVLEWRNFAMKEELKTKKIMILLAAIFSPKSFVFKGAFSIIVCSTLLLILDCARISIKDDLAVGVPKWYVEFYCNTKGPDWVRIHEVDRKNKSTIFEGPVERISFVLVHSGLRVAKNPGIHIFSASVGNVYQEVMVKIEEGMVSPVKITFSDLEEKSSTAYDLSSRPDGITITRTFKMFLTVEKPIPLITDVSR